ncbi:MAG: exonuclease [Desulfuromonas sp.]|nr:MAG: exonuclease [Desulfuromonas sp.]
MGILANSVSISQFAVEGDLPSGDLTTWVGEHLMARRFVNIDQSADELSVGWVELDDSSVGDFSLPAYSRDHYLFFSLRRDQRRIPPTLLRSYLELAQRDFLAANPGLNRVPKARREELKEAVYGSLLARTLPTPAIFDAVWDTRCQRLTLANLSPKVVDLFETQFRQSFPGLRLVPIHPYARALSVVSPTCREALQQANGARGDGILEMIRDNRWIGDDFLLWMMFATMNGSAAWRIDQPGPAAEGETFTAYLNDRLVLCGGGEEGTQKVTVSGPQSNFSEVCVALQNGKSISEAVLYLEKNENLWKLNLKGELFQFASYRAPAVHLEKDALTDAASEREAVFFERMAVVEEGLQLFDSLFAAFLEQRLGAGWPATQRAISAWLQGSL